MGSKRTKKSRQDQDIFPENSIQNTGEISKLETEINHIPIDNNSVVPAVVPKAPKRKKKTEGTEVPKKVKRTISNENESKKVKVKKKKPKDDISIENEENKQTMNGINTPEVVDIQQNNKTDASEKKKCVITWPDQDIIELINRMESNIPDKDALAYRSRIEKLNWDNVSFKSYNAEACKSTWLQVQKRIRRFRLLKEILHDAKEWVNTPRVNHKLPRPRKHPDMPRRPLSSYLLFYLTKKDEIVSEHPGLDGSDLTKIVGQIYKNLPPEKKEKYEKMAATNREEYLAKLKIFFESHPEIVPPQRLHLNLNRAENEKTVKVEKDKLPVLEKPVTTKVEKLPTAKVEKPPKVEKEKPVKTEKLPKVEKVKTVKSPKGEKKPGKPPRPAPTERPPKKCQTPFGLYYAAELKNMEAGTDKAAFREKCKAQYKQMNDKKKVIWINLAEQDLIRYQEELKTYIAKYPDYKGGFKVRSILTKREKASKERASGKPVKPANSAYALYSRVMLQSDEIKSIHPKDRMNYIANKWKNCTEEEQNIYKDQVAHLMAQYKQEYDAYVNTLPEEEKRNILQASKRKRGSKVRPIPTCSRIRKPRKRKPIPKTPSTKPKFTEPEQPPISACKYFATLYKGDGDPVQAWKTLGVDEKRKYEDELVKKKQAYIIEFEKFLKSLSKEELEAFSQSRQQQVQSDDEETSDCSDSEGDEEDDEDDEHNEENGEMRNDEEGHESDSD